MKHTKTRLLSLVLAIGMIVSLFPSTALAEGDPPQTTPSTVTEVGSAEGLVATIADGGSTKLTADVALTEMIMLDKSITIDLNGHKLSNTTGNSIVQVVNDATLTINGTTTGSKVYGRINLGIAANANGGINGNAVLNGGTYSCANEQTVLHINGECQNSNVTISGATINSPTDNGIQLNGKGEFLIEDSAITGATGVYIKAGTLTVKNSTITGNMTPANYTYYGNGAYATGDAVVVDACNYPGGNPTVTIESGTFSGTKAAIGYYQHTGSDATAPLGTATITVNGGKFSDASWLPYVADTATIKLANDVAGPGIVTAAGDNLTLDLNGHTYTINSPVGSDGTVTNGMQLFKGSTVKIMNGTIAAATDAGVKIVLKNYANLTLENVHIDGENVSLNTVNNCGQLVINGANTVIEKPAGSTWAVLTGNYGHGDVITTIINAGTIDSVANETPLWEIGYAAVDESVTTTINGGVIGTVGEYDWRPAYGEKYANAPMLTNAQLIINSGSFTDLAGLPYVAAGKTYTLGTSYTLPFGKSATVPANVKLLVPAGVTLTNNGAIANEGAITVVGTLKGNAVTGTVNGNAPVVEAPKPAEVVEVVTAINPENQAAVTENKAVIEAAVAAIAETTDKTELKTNAMIEDLGKLEELYVAANEKIKPTQVVTTAVPSQITGVAVDNAALSVPANVQTETAPTVTVAAVTLSTDATTNILEAAGVETSNTVIPLAIELKVNEEKIQPVAPLAFKVKVGVTEDVAKKMVIAHVKDNGPTEIIRPTVSVETGENAGVYLSFVTTSLSNFVIVETNSVVNPNAYTVTLTPDKSIYAPGESAVYTIKAQRTTGTDKLSGIDLVLTFSDALNGLNPVFVDAEGGLTLSGNLVEDGGLEGDPDVGKYKISGEEMDSGWETGDNEVVLGTLTFEATGTGNALTIVPTASSMLSNGGYEDPAALTITVDDATQKVLTITLTDDTTHTYYAKSGDPTKTLYTDEALSKPVDVTPAPANKDGYRLLDTENWYLGDFSATFASFNSFTSNQSFVAKYAQEFGISATPGNRVSFGNTVINNKAAQGIDVTFTVSAVNGMVSTVTYSVGAGAGVALTAEEGVYTIPGANITGTVAVTVTDTLALSADDIKVFTQPGDLTAWQTFSGYSGSKTLVLIKAIDGVNNLAFTAANAPTVFKTNGYNGYAYAVLINGANVETVTAAGMLAYMMDTLELDASTTAPKTLSYDFNTNGKTGGKLIDVQAAYDFFATGVTMHWTPTDNLLLIADVNNYVAPDDATITSPNKLVNYTAERDGKLTAADVDAFLYLYAQFRPVAAN